MMLRISAAFFSLLLMTAPASAGPDASTAPVKGGVFSWASTAPLTVPAVLQRFEEFDSRLSALTGDFSQSLAMSRTGMSSEVEGTVAYAKPELLRIEHTAPERQTVVSDGKDIWIYRHSRNQAIQSDLREWKRADPTLNNLMQFGSYSKMLRTYAVSLDTGDARLELVLVPREKPDGRESLTLRLILDPDTLFPQTTVLEVGGIRVRTELRNMVFNPEIQPETFRFQPPAGADVFRDFKPPRLDR